MEGLGDRITFVDTDRQWAALLRSFHRFGVYHKPVGLANRVTEDVKFNLKGNSTRL